MNQLSLFNLEEIQEVIPEPKPSYILYRFVPNGLRVFRNDVKHYWTSQTGNYAKFPSLDKAYEYQTWLFENGYSDVLLGVYHNGVLTDKHGNVITNS